MGGGNLSTQQHTSGLCSVRSGVGQTVVGQTVVGQTVAGQMGQTDDAHFSAAEATCPRRQVRAQVLRVRARWVVFVAACSAATPGREKNIIVILEI